MFAKKREKEGMDNAVMFLDFLILMNIERVPLRLISYS